MHRPRSFRPCSELPGISWRLHMQNLAHVAMLTWPGGGGGAAAGGGARGAPPPPPPPPRTWPCEYGEVGQSLHPQSPGDAR
jgi:hypothetical protein